MVAYSTRYVQLQVYTYQAFEVLGLVECGGSDTARLCAVRVCAVWVPTPVPSVGAGRGRVGKEWTTVQPDSEIKPWIVSQARGHLFRARF